MEMREQYTLASGNRVRTVANYGRFRRFHVTSDEELHLHFDANSARCGLRYTHLPHDRGFSLGFRVAADRR